MLSMLGCALVCLGVFIFLAVIAETVYVWFWSSDHELGQRDQDRDRVPRPNVRRSKSCNEANDSGLGVGSTQVGDRAVVSVFRRPRK